MSDEKSGRAALLGIGGVAVAFLGLSALARRSTSRFNTFYHASMDELTPGEVLTARPRPATALDDVEEVIESQRPPWDVSRKAALYSTDNKKALLHLAGERKHVYEVEPQGHVTVADFDNWTEVGMALADVKWAAKHGRKFSEK